MQHQLSVQSTLNLFLEAASSNSKAYERLLVAMVTALKSVGQEIPPPATFAL